MIDNVQKAEELRAISRRKRQSDEFKTIPKSLWPQFEQEGWRIQRENRENLRVARPKSKQVLLEDRVWSLLYQMGFSHLSGKRGAILVIDPSKPDGARNQIDVVGLDREVALAIECKSSEEPRKNPEFAQQLAKHALIRERFAKAVNTSFSLDHKRIVVLAFFTWDFLLSDNDIQRAEHEKVVLFNEHELEYYENLVGHLGPAAKYQLFADMLPNRRIHGLEIEVPALKTKMGKNTCYIFSITPTYLLKIGYVSHRIKGKPTDIDTYQRMIKKSRLTKIREYINQNGIFPTNIIISLESGKGHIRFDRHQHKGTCGDAEYGTLHLTPCYKSAWIIDGQHRLFAYSGHERAEKSHVSVLAFEGLPPSEQAQLFIDINHEQKSVKRSLLYELYAELNWDADDEAKRVSAIISKAIQALDQIQDSPLRERILLADAPRSPTRCISLESIFKALSQPGMFITKKQVEYGPMWAGDNNRTLKRCIYILKEWFRILNESGAREWWDLGSLEGGGLAMNDGVTILIGVLRSVFEHLNAKLPLIRMTDTEVLDKITPYARDLGIYLGTLPVEQRKTFRGAWRGGQGQTAGRREFEKFLNSKFSDFQPRGLKEYLDLQASDTNKKAYEIIQRIETTLKSIVLQSLREEYETEDQWWYNSIPQNIRKKVMERVDEDKGVGRREDYFDLIDFRNVAIQNWELFKDSLGFGNKGNKETKTNWIAKVNEMRKIVMHPAKGRFVTWGQLSELEEYEKWLSHT